MSEIIQHHIRGERFAAQGCRTQAVFNPATGEEIASVALGGAEEVNRAVAAAKQAFEPTFPR